MPDLSGSNNGIDDAIRLAANASASKPLPMRFGYGQRYNPQTGRLDAADSKDIGFRGPVSNGDHIVSEYSADRDGIQYPSVYSGISDADLAAIMTAERMHTLPPASVDDRAYAAAMARVNAGRSPFYEHGKDPYPVWSPNQYWEAPAVITSRADGGNVSGSVSYMPEDTDHVANALRIANDGASRFVRGQLDSGEPQLPQYDPEGGWNTAKYAAGRIASVTGPGGVADALGMLGEPSAAEQWRSGDKIGAAMTAAGAIPGAGVLKAIIPVAAAKGLRGARALPGSELFERAVANTPGARVEDGSLVMPVARRQMSEQHGAPSVRGGVFYLPEGDKNLKYYTGKNNYGGSDLISGETAFNNPMFVKGSTGGKAPEAAYAALHGKDAMTQLDKDVMKAVTDKYWMTRQDGPALYAERVGQLLDQYGVDPDIADHIIDNSTQGNQLRYALQENIIGQAVRDAGHDSVLGYSVRRNPSKDPFISEVYDVRESHYPTPWGGYDVWDKFRADGGSVTGDVQYASDDHVANAMRVANEPTMQAYEPTIKERIANYFMGDERPSPERRQFANGIADMASFIPGLGNAMAGQEAYRAGDRKGMALAAIPLPGASKEAAIANAARMARPAGRMTAYHVSPHEFDQFALGRGVGTGEGAYGRGAYLSSSQDGATAWTQNMPAGQKYLYQVDVPFDHSSMLDYGAPLHTHSEQVRGALSNLDVPSTMPKRNALGGYDDVPATGGYAYDVLRNRLGHEGASSALREAGIPGMRIPAGDRSDYVIYDPSTLNVLNKARYADGGAVLNALRLAAHH